MDQLVLTDELKMVSTTSRIEKWPQIQRDDSQKRRPLLKPNEREAVLEVLKDYQNHYQKN